jgi:PadR family transcriptional regulator, regulatory protein AphA
MSLAYAILGFLAKSPQTGYDLKTRCFDPSVNYFWAADQAQIYRTLDKLTEDGLVQNEIEYQDTRPNRKVYHITEKGRAELKRWLKTSIPLPMRREPHLVQLFFSDVLSNEEVIALLEEQIRLHRQLHAEYNHIPLPPLDAPMEREDLFGRFTLEFGLRLEQMQIEWLEACIARLREEKT